MGGSGGVERSVGGAGVERTIGGKGGEEDFGRIRNCDTCRDAVASRLSGRIDKAKWKVEEDKFKAHRARVKVQRHIAVREEYRKARKELEAKIEQIKDKFPEEAAKLKAEVEEMRRGEKVQVDGLAAAKAEIKQILDRNDGPNTGPIKDDFARLETAPRFPGDDAPGLR